MGDIHQLKLWESGNRLDEIQVRQDVAAITK